MSAGVLRLGFAAPTTPTKANSPSLSRISTLPAARAEPLAGFARTKAGSPQFTGIVERYRKTMLNAFHHIV
jgi:hypothetical protein